MGTDTGHHEKVGIYCPNNLAKVIAQCELTGGEKSKQRYLRYFLRHTTLF